MRAQKRYRHECARRALRGIDEQVAKAEEAVAGKAPLESLISLSVSSQRK
jgi:hypothetical protein